MATRQDFGQFLPESVLDVTYALMQQLVPGETLAPQKLAMGQTYEQLDKGEQGRLGKSKYIHLFDDTFTILYFAILYCIALYCTALFRTVFNCTVLYCIVLHCTDLCCMRFTVLYCTILYCTLLYCTILCCMYCTVLCCFVLICAVLHMLRSHVLSCPVLALSCTLIFWYVGDLRNHLHVFFSQNYLAHFIISDYSLKYYYHLSKNFIRK